VKFLQLTLGGGLALAGLPLLTRREAHLEEDGLALPFGKAAEEFLKGQELLRDTLDRVKAIAAHEDLLALKL
jgi:hypothetical protein